MADMKPYRVTWEVQVDAETPLQAAKEARLIQLDPESLPPVFTVLEENMPGAVSVDVDLSECEDGPVHVNEPSEEAEDAN